MSFETESYKEMQMWEIITRLKKLEGDDLESLVKYGSNKISSAVKFSVDSAENPYKKRYRFVSSIPKPLTPYVLYDRSSQLAGLANNPFAGSGGQQAAAASGGTLGLGCIHTGIFGAI